MRESVPTGDGDRQYDGELLPVPASVPAGRRGGNAYRHGPLPAKLLESTKVNWELESQAGSSRIEDTSILMTRTFSDTDCVHEAVW